MVFRIRMSKAILAFVCSWLLAFPLHAQLIISAGDYELDANGGTIPVSVSGGLEASSINLAISPIPTSAASGSQIILSAADPLAAEDSIWKPGVIFIPAPPLPAEASVFNVVQRMPVVADGTLFELTLDTSQTQIGDTFELELNFRGLSSAANGAENLTPQFEFHNGLITIVPLPGDYNANGRFDVEDIETLYAAIHAGSEDPIYDLDQDGGVGKPDADFWVSNIAKTFAGDANLDGEFNSTDLIQVFSRGEYEDGVAGNSTWSDGDWNGDTEFDSGDLIVAFQADAYEKGPRVGTITVPEPEFGPNVVLLLALLFGKAIRGQFFRVS